jgi:hypothetical protein
MGWRGRGRVRVSEGGQACVSIHSCLVFKSTSSIHPASSRPSLRLRRGCLYPRPNEARPATRWRLTAFGEPLDVAILESTMHDSLVGPVEGEVVLCHLVPENVRVLDRLLVHGLVGCRVDMGLDVLVEQAVGALCYFAARVSSSQSVCACMCQYTIDASRQ